MAAQGRARKSPLDGDDSSGTCWKPTGGAAGWARAAGGSIHETFAQITETCSVPAAVPSFATATSQPGFPVVSEIAYADVSVRIFAPTLPMVK